MCLASKNLYVLFSGCTIILANNYQGLLTQTLKKFKLNKTSHIQRNQLISFHIAIQTLSYNWYAINIKALFTNKTNCKENEICYIYHIWTLSIFYCYMTEVSSIMILFPFFFSSLLGLQTTLCLSYEKMMLLICLKWLTLIRSNFNRSY